MKSLKLIAMGVSVIFFVTSAIAKAPQEKEQKEEISVKKTPVQTVASTILIGPYRGMYPLFGKIRQWMGDNGLVPAGPPTAIFFNRPQDVPAESLKTEIQWPVMGANLDSLKKVEGEIKVKDVPAMEVAYTIHTGGYENVGAIYQGLMKWIGEHGYQIAGQAREVYLTDFSKTPMKGWRTEIQFPVVKKAAEKEEEKNKE